MKKAMNGTLRKAVASIVALACTISLSGIAFVPAAEALPAYDAQEAASREASAPNPGEATIVALPKDKTTPTEVAQSVQGIDEGLGSRASVDLTDNPSAASHESVVTVETDAAATGEVIERMEDSGLYEAVDIEHYYHLDYTATPNDPYFTAPVSASMNQWNLKSTGYGSRFDTVWPDLASATSAASASIAVLDAGFTFTHTDTGTNLVKGYDYGDGDSDVSPVVDPIVESSAYHGTFVANLIAANTDNGKGIAGAAWDTKVICYKVMNRYEQIPTKALVDAINAAITKKVAVINMSLGGSQNDTVLAAACLKARKSGIVVVASAGNEGSATSGGPIEYPAANEGVVSVGASDQSGKRASFSTYNRFVDLVAPGTDIVSVGTGKNGYIQADGTSFSAPEVSAASALLKRFKPALTAVQIEDIVSRSARDVTSTGVGWDQKTGWGILDMKAAYDLSQGAVVSSTGLSLSKTSVSAVKGTSFSLKAAVTPATSSSTLAWISSNTSVATVSQSGNTATVSCIRPGSATISVRTSSGLAKECVVKVVPVKMVSYGGNTRVDVGVNVSKGTYARSTSVVVASGEVFPDALAASPFSSAIGGPVLLTTGKTLSSQVGAEIKRLGATKIYVVGGPGTISKAVENQLKAYGPVERIWGPDRYSNAVAIGNALSAKSGKVAEAFLVSGENFPDALSVSPFAARNKIPILLTPSKKLAPSASSFLSKQGIRTVYVAGGAGSVSSEIQARLEARGIKVVRWGGATRYDVSKNVASGGMALWGSSPAVVGVASGENFPDALTGGASLGSPQKNGVLLLTKPSTLSPQASDVIRTKRSTIKTVEVYGGPASVSNATRNQIFDQFR